MNARLIAWFSGGLLAATASLLAATTSTGFGNHSNMTVPDAQLGADPEPAASEFPLIFDMPELDLGEVSDAADISHAFNFVNASNRPVRVELRNYCHHCEQPEIVPTLVRAGDSGVVIVDIKTAGKSGLVRGGATIGVQGMTLPTVQLTVTATVVPDAAFDPPMVQVGDVALGESASATAALIVRTAGATLRMVESNMPGIMVNAEAPEPHSIGKLIGTKIPLRLSIRPDLPTGYHVAEIRVETGTGQRLTLPVNVHVLPTLKATPADIGLDRLVGGQEFSTVVSIASRDASSVKISAIGLSDPAEYTQGAVPAPVSKLTDLSLSMSLEEPFQIARVRVSGRAPLSPGGYELFLKVQGGAGPQDVLSVPIRFRVKF